MRWVGGGAVRAVDVLAEASRLADGQRDATHGPGRANFAATADLWNAFLAHVKGPLQPWHVAEMMALTKLARKLVGAPEPDHWFDGCAYGAISGELKLGGRSPPAAATEG